jgi:plasmid stability protein
MEEEARDILRTVPRTSSVQSANLADAIRKRFAVCGGIDLELPQRGKIRHTPDFQE